MGFADHGLSARSGGISGAASRFLDGRRVEQSSVDAAGAQEGRAFSRHGMDCTVEPPDSTGTDCPCARDRSSGPRRREAGSSPGLPLLPPEGPSGCWRWEPAWPCSVAAEPERPGATSHKPARGGWAPDVPRARRQGGAAERRAETEDTVVQGRLSRLYREKKKKPAAHRL